MLKEYVSCQRKHWRGRREGGPEQSERWCKMWLGANLTANNCRLGLWRGKI